MSYPSFLFFTRQNEKILKLSAQEKILKTDKLLKENIIAGKNSKITHEKNLSLNKKQFFCIENSKNTKNIFLREPKYSTRKFVKICSKKNAPENLGKVCSV